MVFKAAIFDVGGVLQESPIAHFRKYAAKHDLPAKFVMGALKKNVVDNPIARAEKGNVTVAQMAEEVDRDFQESAKKNGLELPSTFSVLEMLKGLKALPPFKEMVNAVANLKNYGFKTGILNNSVFYDLPSLSEDCDGLTFYVTMRFMFDEIVESCQTGLRKPDEELYSLACQRMSVTPQEAIFIDNQQCNLDPAKKLGMATVLFTDVPSTLTKLQELTGVDVAQKAEPVAVDPDKVPHGFVTTKDGVRLHYVEMGEGPAVILCHGFPESWYSWRKQIPALVLAGYRVIVPDLRGFGDTSSPLDVRDYTLDHACSDLKEIMDFLSIPRASVVGRGLGGTVAWEMALRYPFRVRSIVSINSSYFPLDPKSNLLEKQKREPDTLDYMSYFLTLGVAEAELEKDLEKTFKYFFRGTQDCYPGMEKHTLSSVTKRGGILAGVPDDISVPSLITEKDLAYFVKQYKTSGFRGPLNWFRNMEQNLKNSLKDAGRKIHAPALVVTAEKDGISPPSAGKQIEQWVPDLSRVHIKNCGHWSQIERPGELNEGLIKWLNDIHEKANVPVKPRF